MSFCTAVNCMDGRVQEPVIAFLRERFGAKHVDVVSEPGPNGMLASGDPPEKVESILERIRISLEAHDSVGIGVVGHHDCAGNPGDREKQDRDTLEAVLFLRRRFPGVPVTALYVDAAWTVIEIG